MQPRPMPPPRGRVPAGPPDPRDRGVELGPRDLVRALWGRRWMLAALAAAALAGAAAYLHVARPVYRATMSLATEQVDPFGSKVEGVTPLVHGDPSTEGDLELLRSRAVLGEVVDALALGAPERRPREDAVDALQAGLWIEEKAKGSGVLSITLDGPDPARLVAILRSLAAVYLARDVEHRAEEEARTLAFLDGQLPALKARLDRAEELLAEYRAAQRTVSFPWETRKAAEWSAAAEAARATLETERALAARRYTPRHPDAVALDRALEAARAQEDGVAPRLGAIPPVEVGAGRLGREIAMAADLYLLLSRQAETLRVAQAGTVSHVRVVDEPVASARPIRPAPASVVILALFLALGGGAAVVLTRLALDDVASGARAIEDATGLPVLAAVPHSAREAARRWRRRPRQALAVAAPDDPATESLRGLRALLAFTRGARGSVLAVGAPSAGDGKTFVATNLAHLAAGAGERVLLVDGDLRRGSLHRPFALEPGPGLSDVLARAAPLERAIRRTEVAGLDVLSRGERRRGSAELLAGAELETLLAAAAARYDLVVVDTPPVLAVADGAIVARHAGTTLLVLRAGRHRLRDVARALERYARSGVAVHGAVLNDARDAGDAERAPGGAGRA